MSAANRGINEARVSSDIAGGLKGTFVDLRARRATAEATPDGKMARRAALELVLPLSQRESAGARERPATLRGAAARWSNVAEEPIFAAKSLQTAVGLVFRSSNV